MKAELEGRILSDRYSSLRAGETLHRERGLGNTLERRLKLHTSSLRPQVIFLIPSYSFRQPPMPLQCSGKVSA